MQKYNDRTPEHKMLWRDMQTNITRLCQRREGRERGEEKTTKSQLREKEKRDYKINTWPEN